MYQSIIIISFLNRLMIDRKKSRYDHELYLIPVLWKKSISGFISTKCIVLKIQYKYKNFYLVWMSFQKRKANQTFPKIKFKWEINFAYEPVKEVPFPLDFSSISNISSTINLSAKVIWLNKSSFSLSAIISLPHAIILPLGNWNKQL